MATVRTYHLVVTLSLIAGAAFSWTDVIAVGGVNDAPVLDSIKTPTLGTMSVNASAPSGAVGTLISSLVDFATPSGQVDNVTDADEGEGEGSLLGIAITASNGSLTCYYSINGGSSWSAIGSVSNSSARLLAADANTRVYCRPGSAGSYPSALTFRAWDRTAGSNGGVASTNSNGGTTAYSTATDTVTLTVVENDPPSATNLSAAETYTEDTTKNLTDIVVTDADDDDITAMLTLSSAAAGSLTTGTSGAVTSTYDAETGVWTAAGAVANVNILLAGISFIPAANYNSSFTIATSVSDGTFAAETGTKGMTGTPVNDAPVLDSSKSPTMNSISEDADAPSGAVGTLVSSLVDFTSPVGGLDNVADIDSGASTGIAIMDGSLSCYYSLDGGTIWSVIGAVSSTYARLLAADADNRVYCNAGANQNGTFSSTLTFRAWDQTSGSDGGTASTSSSGGSTAFSTTSDTVSLTVTAVDDAPGVPTSLGATAASTTQINLTWTAPMDEGDSTVTGYMIERESPTGNGFTTLVADTGSDDTSYADTGLSANTEYNYRVSAISSVGTGDASASASAMTASSLSVDESDDDTEETVAAAPARGGGRRGSPGRGGSAKALLTLLNERKHAAAERQPSTEFERRTCDRVMKWFKNDAKMLGRVNERLQKRFGFTCTE